MTELERVNDRINELVEQRRVQLEEIDNRLNDLASNGESARSMMKDAAAVLNEKAYADAEAKLKRAESMIEMYKSRREQISSQEYIGEEESEETINSLLDYEDKLEADFKKAIEPHLSALEEIRDKYVFDVSQTEQMIMRWTNTIRRSFYNRSGSQRVVNGKWTNRFDEPQPIHRVSYLGCKASSALGTLLDTVKQSL